MVAISLLVGGIGIINIMLGVGDRTNARDRHTQSLGARRKDILLQFLIESVVLSLLGGIIGTVLGWLLGMLAVSLIPGISVSHVPGWAVALAFGVAGGTGVIFGILPAAKAANLNPIECPALRITSLLSLLPPPAGRGSWRGIPASQTPYTPEMTSAIFPAGTILVAHRGDATHHPENSMVAFASAASLGIPYVELDVQLTSDGVPIVLHDESLARTHGLDVNVTRTSLQELTALGVLAGGNRPPPVPQLAEFVEWMHKTPRMHVFVEIKKESLHAHGRKRVLEAVAHAIEKIRARATIISYDARVLAMAKRGGWPVGYVLPGMSRRYKAVAEHLDPRFLFADYRQILRAGAPWPGGWDWATFDLEDIATAQKMARLGVRYLETMNPALFIAPI